VADTREQREQKYLAAFLDQVAEYFDAETPVSPETLFDDPIDGQPTTARRLLRKIRLGEHSRDFDDHNRGVNRG
jgi:hypothetical protein